MRILVTNDDGIHAPGLAVAESIARALSDDVWVVAPENEQSGASHSLTLTVPLRVRAIEEKEFYIITEPGRRKDVQARYDQLLRAFDAAEQRLPGILKKG